MNRSTEIISRIEQSEQDAPVKGLLKEQAYVELKRLILARVFRPGTFLSERQLSERLEMSKTPIRAALERLEAEGFVSVSPKQGILVRELSLQEIADQFEIRAALEAFVLRRLAGKLTAEQSARLTQNLQQQQAAAADNDPLAASRLDADFHLMFGEFLGNQEILNVMLRLRDQNFRLINRVLSQNSPRFLPNYEEHAAIAAAVLSGQGDLAAQLLEKHLEFGRQFLLSPRQLAE